VAIKGTSGDDDLTGGNDDDVILGKAGDDIIHGGGGNDNLDGGQGADEVHGGDGDDKIAAAAGDNITGDDGDDAIVFSASMVNVAHANIQGNFGDDILTLDFSAVSWRVSGVHSGDESFGGSGGIEMFDPDHGWIGGVGFGGIDRISYLGGSGNDVMVTGVGNDELFGGKGNDDLDGARGGNVIDGGAGNDYGRIDLSGSDTNRTIVFDPAQTLKIGGNTLSRVEGLGAITGGGKDMVDVSAEILGAKIATGDGNDTVIGGAAIDRIDTGNGNDTIAAGHGDIVLAGAGNDKVTVELTGHQQRGTPLDGGADVDTLILDASTYKDGLFFQYFSNNNGRITYAGTNVSIDYQGFETLDFHTGKGADTLVGGNADDVLNGGGNDDTLEGGSGADSLTGGTGHDHFIWRELSDSTVVKAGRDTVEDFAQGDKFDLSILAFETGAHLKLVGDAHFSHTAGEIQAKASGDDTLVRVDTSGDGTADFAFLVRGAHVFHDGDFILR
jgi:Ca2+-binding RTX toxin-like protein